MSFDTLSKIVQTERNAKKAIPNSLGDDNEPQKVREDGAGDLIWSTRKKSSAHSLTNEQNFYEMLMKMPS